MTSHQKKVDKNVGSLRFFHIKFGLGTIFYLFILLNQKRLHQGHVKILSEDFPVIVVLLNFVSLDHSFFIHQTIRT